MNDLEDAMFGGRHRGREVALQVLYAIDLAVDEGEESILELKDEIFKRITQNFDVPQAVEAFASELVNGVVVGIAALDEILGIHARNWRVSPYGGCGSKCIAARGSRIARFGDARGRRH